MKIAIDSQTRPSIEAFLARFKPAIESLRSKCERTTDLGNRLLDNETALSAVTTVDDPSDKQIQQILICRERALILQSRGDELTPKIEQEKKAVVRLSDEATELYRSIAGKQLYESAEAELKASLPATITNDSHLMFKIWNDGVEKRSIRTFLNPPALTPNDDEGMILEESGRRAQLLEDLVHERDVNFIEAPFAIA